MTALDTNYENSLAQDRASYDRIMTQSKLRMINGFNSLTRSSQLSYWFQANCGKTSISTLNDLGSYRLLSETDPNCLAAVLFNAQYDLSSNLTADF